jgi:hypothetical protein
MKRWWLTKLANQIQYNELEKLILFLEKIHQNMNFFGNCNHYKMMNTCQWLRKQSTTQRGRKKVQDGKTQVLANEESCKEGEPLREQEQIMKLPPPPKVMRSIMLFLKFCWKNIAEKGGFLVLPKKEGFWTGFARPRAFSKSLARSSCGWLPTCLHHKSGKKRKKKTPWREEL